MIPQIIKMVGLSAVLLIPALQGMVKIDELLPVQLRHRGYTPLHLAAFFGQIEKITPLSSVKRG